MTATINCNAVRVCGEEAFTNLFQVAAMLIEDRDDAALRRNVKTSKALIKGEHVRISADRVNSRQFLCFQIKDRQLRIPLAGNECQTAVIVDKEAVAFTTTRQRVTTDYLILVRIDLGKYQVVGRPSAWL